MGWPWRDGANALFSDLFLLNSAEVDLQEGLEAQLDKLKHGPWGGNWWSDK